jgi:hypothetical protein
MVKYAEGRRGGDEIGDALAKPRNTPSPRLRGFAGNRFLTDNRLFLTLKIRKKTRASRITMYLIRAAR